MSKDISGGYSSGVPPLPIPNREVKPRRADGTARKVGEQVAAVLEEGRDSGWSPSLYFYTYWPYKAYRAYMAYMPYTDCRPAAAMLRWIFFPNSKLCLISYFYLWIRVLCVFLLIIYNILSLYTFNFY